MDVVNLTPHAVTLVHADGHTEIFPSAGEARAEEIPGAPWNNPSYPIPIRSMTRYSYISGLPARHPEPTAAECVSGPHGPPDRVYIVSHIVAERIRAKRNAAADGERERAGSQPIVDLFKRDDIVTPGSLMRDEAGRVIGCRTFVSVW
jgi:hypothetical protein